MNTPLKQPAQLLNFCLIALVFCINYNTTLAQNTPLVFEQYDIENSLFMVSGVEWHPKKKNICAVAHTQGHAIFIYNSNTRKVQSKIKISGYYAGPKITWSQNGRYLLLEQKFYIDMSLSKDRKVQYDVVDVSTGETVLALKDIHSACFSADGNALHALSKNQVTVYNLSYGNTLRSFAMSQYATGIAMGKTDDEFYASIVPTKKQLEKVPSIYGNKAAMKAAEKYRQMIGVFSSEDGKLLRLIPEIYDVIYAMKNISGKMLVFARAHRKLKAGSGSYINVINLENEEPLSVGFQTKETDADFKLSNDGKYLGVVDLTTDKMPRPSLKVYNANTGAIDYYFDYKFSVFQKFGKGEVTDNKLYFLFDQDKPLAYLFTGNQIYQWSYTE